jgi:hypothetical protein
VAQEYDFSGRIVDTRRVSRWTCRCAFNLRPVVIYYSMAIQIRSQLCVRD